MDESRRITVVGSINMDLVVKAPRLPKRGETLIGGQFVRSPGGKGANQAVAAARLGCQVYMVGRVGADPFGDELAASLRSSGVKADYLIRDRAAPSGIALIVVGRRGENMIVVAPGANANLTPDDIDKARDIIAESKFVIVQLEIPLETVEHTMDIAEAHGVPVILNPAPAKKLPPSILSKASIITPNETEAALMTSIEVTDPLSAGWAAEALLAMGAPAVVITMGKLGAYVDTSFRSGHIPTYPVEAVDTTAAGDAFTGALAAFLTSYADIEAAVRYANAAAAFSVTVMGAQPSLPTAKQVEEFLNTVKEPL